MKAISFFSILLLTACVTINIYFPAAAAEKVADEIIKGIQTETDETTLFDTGYQITVPLKNNTVQLAVYSLVDKMLTVLIPSAHAADADLAVNTAEIRGLRSSMKARFSSLKTYYSRGLIGVKNDGFIVVKGSVPLKDKNKVNKLISAENTNRQQLYQAIANANGHPEWFAQIKSTFATRWVSNAESGWWYQSSNGSWKQK